MSAIEQAAAGQGGEVPEEGTPQYNAALVPALSDLLLGRWVRGEADERGIEVTDREIDVELQTIIEEQFGGQEEFDKFLEQSGFSEEDALDRVELQLLTQCLQDQVVPQDPEAPAPTTERQGCQGEEEVEITQDEIQKFYDDNITQFETPETRDVRTLLNPDEEKAQEAADRLAEDPTAETWEDVAKELSTEKETADLGGLRPGVQEGQNEPALDEAIFSAAEGEVVGPIEVEGTGFYVIQVDKVNAAATQPLDETTSDQIRQQLVTQEQQQAVTDFQDEFVIKWRARTVCSEDLLADDTDGTVESQLAERCSNFSVTDDGCLGDDESDELQPDPVTGEVPKEPTGCGAFVPSRPVIPAIPLPQEEENPLLATPGWRGDSAAAGPAAAARRRGRATHGRRAARPAGSPSRHRSARNRAAWNRAARHGAARNRAAHGRTADYPTGGLSVSGETAAALARLDEITRRLRVECPWDREQDERSIVPHTVEEAYELADAAAQGDDVKLEDELGDVLFQVYFLALLLEERGAGSLASVAEGMSAKLVRRHPHVFGEAEASTSRQVLRNWDQIKRDVEGRGAGDPFADVPENLPGLLYARKILRRAAPDEGSPAPEDPGARDRAERWLGEVLLELVRISRRLGVDPELAVRAAAGRAREEARGAGPAS